VDLFRLLDRGGCRHQAVCRYFDETIDPCGMACDVCLGMSLDRVAPPRSPGRGIVPSWPTAEASRFERLRALRRRLADRENVPPYVVFSDAVLRELAARRPHSEADLLAIPGIGPVKVARYGPAFLDLLKEESPSAQTSERFARRIGT
jgi:superfamily II DNA helicase RecQ